VDGEPPLTRIWSEGGGCRHEEDSNPPPSCVWGEGGGGDVDVDVDGDLH
jgi:hypothetical protein